MDTQTSLNPKLVFVLANQPIIQPVQACSCDYGFDFDDEEIANEMLVPLPAGLSGWAASQPDVDELDFDTLQFLS